MKRSRPPSRRSLLETSFAFAAGFFAILAAVWPNWIEAFGVDPDHGDGSFEWAIPIVLGVAALVLGLLAQRHWNLDAAKAVGT